MGVKTPDILRTMNRQVTVSSGSRPTVGVNGAPRKTGESFEQFLNRSAVSRQGSGGAGAAASGSGLAGLLNREQMPAESETAANAPKAGESLTAFLNRQRVATGSLNQGSVPAAAPRANAAAGNATGAGSVTGAIGRAGLNQMKVTDPAADRHAQAEKAAEGLVANALILPVLKQLRRSPFGKNSVFSGGIGEKTFGPEFDMQLADRIAQSPRLGVKEALVKRLESRGMATQARGTQSAKATRLDVNG